MRTLDQIGQLAADYIDSPTDPEVIGYSISGVRECVDFLNQRCWSFQLVVSGFGFIAGQQEYTFPNGIKQPRHLSIVDAAGTRTPVGYTDYKSFTIENQAINHGNPTIYTVIPGTNTVRLNGAPTADTIATQPSGEFAYFERIAFPTVTASGVVVPTEVERLLIEYARAFAAERYDSDKVGPPTQRFQYGFRQLRANESEALDWSE